MRTIIEKYQRISQIQEQYGEQIKALAKQQLEIDCRLIKEFKLDNDYDYRKFLNYDYLKVGEDGNVELWETGRCGDSDSYETEISIHPLVLKGDLKGYEQLRRTEFQQKAIKAAEAKQVEKQKERERLEKQIAQINTQLVQLGAQQ